MMGKLSGFKSIHFVFGFWIGWMAGGGLSLLHAAQAGESIYKSLSFYWENDGFTGTDRDYTNGLKWTLSTALLPGGRETKHMPDWSYGVMDHLPLLRDENTFRGFALSLGHTIYTPKDTDRSDFIEDDRPYAGYLYMGFGFQAHYGRRFSIWELDFGVVGPLAMAEELQGMVHRAIGADRAQGWEHQLDNEPALQLIHETRWRIWDWESANGFGCGLIVHAGGQLGNVAVLANTGGEIRLGWAVPEDFGSCPIRPGCNESGLNTLSDSAGLAGRPLSIHLFLGFDGRLVLRDIFIDGNTGGSGTHIQRKTLTGDIITGIAFSYKRFKMSYGYVLSTKRFEEQEEDQKYGAILIHYTF